MATAKILVIDDEPEMLDLLKNVLEKDGYEVLLAKNGKAGLELFDSQKPDVVICDIIMPGMDGYQVLKEVRNRGAKGTPFVMLSAVTDFKNISQAYGSEANFYITKPFELSLLLKSVRTLVSLANVEKS